MNSIVPGKYTTSKADPGQVLVTDPPLVLGYYGRVGRLQVLCCLDG